MNNWRKVRPASATFCSKTRGVLYLRVGTSSSMVRQAERGNSTISFISWGDHRPEYLTVGDGGSRRPGVNRHLDPRRHRDRAHPAVLSKEIDDAPATLTLLGVLERKGRHLGSAQA